MQGASRSWTLSRKAENDLAGIWLFSVSQWSVEQADRYYHNMISALDGLSREHLSGRKAIISKHAYFYRPCGSHNIFYRREGARILVVRILHQRMDPERHIS